MTVTDEEADMAEAQVRADYEKGSFELVLIEEYIDLDAWRDRLRADLARKKFIHEVLKPQVKLDPQEAHDYYQTHKSDFNLPERFEFLLVTGPTAESVQAATSMAMQTHDTKAVSAKYENVTVRQLTMREDRLSPGWRKTLGALAPDAVGAVTPTQAGFEALALLARYPSKELDVTQAYPVVEKIVLEKKLQAAYLDWLARETGKADVQVSAHLLSGGNQTEEEANATPSAEEPEEAASFDGLNATIEGDDPPGP